MIVPGFQGRIHPAGWLFIWIGVIVTLFLSLVSLLFMFTGLVLTLWCIYFFRDPERFSPQREDVIVSPADGVVRVICKAPLPKELHLPERNWIRVSIFLNVFDVHVQRIPISGIVEKNVYHPGQFLNASFDKASDVNERRALLITSPRGVQIVCVQIAGLIARRILCDVKEGQSVLQGERYGLIRFGSRVDVYVPSDFPILVHVGQRMVGGETILAEMPRVST